MGHGAKFKPLLTGTADYLKRLNYSAVLATLWREPSLSRSEIADRLGLARSTVGFAVSELIERSLIQESESITSNERVGRPSIPLALDNETNVFLAWEVGVGFLNVAALDFYGRIRAIERITPGEPLDPQGALECTSQASVKLLSELSGPVVRGIGLTVPGMVNPMNGILEIAPNLEWKNVDLGQKAAKAITGQGAGILSKATDGLRLVVENEANAGAAALVTFGGFAARHLAYLSLDVGLGGGLVIDGRLYTGKGGYAGEVGHIVVDGSGPVCHCGKRGCAEVYINLHRWAASTDKPSCVASMGDKLGLLMSHLANTLDLDSIALGGRLIDKVGNELVEASLPRFRANVLPGVQRYLTISRSPFGENTSIVGAGALAAQLFFAQPGTNGSGPSWPSYSIDLLSWTGRGVAMGEGERPIAPGVG